MFLGRSIADSVATVLARLLLVGALLAASGCAWLDERQREIIYRPTPAANADVAGLRPGDERSFLTLPHADGAQQIELWWLPHADPAAPVLLYLHGTFRHLQDNLHKIDALRLAGFAVLAIDYRGWGRSSPIVPSEQTIVQDARLAWAELVRREPRAGQRVLYGHSMGSAVAVALASQLRYPQDYGGLILESAFTSFTDVARNAGFWASLLHAMTRERFAALDQIGQIQAPLLMLHGGQDDTIPIQLGERLFAAANAPKHWLSIDKGQHSDLNLVAPLRYRATLEDFRRRYLSAP